MIRDEPFLTVGSVLKDRYIIEAEVGRGGFSVVYKATDKQLETTVALKLLVPPPVAALSAKERLRREVVALQKLHHSSIIRIYDLYEDDHWSFIIMDFLDGCTLDQQVAQHGPLTQEQTIDVGRQIADALRLVHRNGILHRDVKPQNIMLTKNNQIVLTDFGSAKIEGQATFTAAGAIVGTMGYLAPEVFDGGRPDGRSDIYSLGMCLYFAIMGALPQGGSNYLPPPPTVEGFQPSKVGSLITGELDRVIAQATMMEPGNRFQTMDRMVQALSGEWQLPAVTHNRPLQFCLRCGGPDLLELSVCPSCRSQTEQGDTYIFVEAQLGHESRKHVKQVLQEVTGLASYSSCLTDAAKGVKSLLRTTSKSAPGIVAKFRAQHIPTYSIQLKYPISHIPHMLSVLLFLNLTIGLAAGLWYSSVFFWGALMFSAITVMAVHRTVREPFMRPRSVTLNLPIDVESQVLDTLASLPSGTAKNIFADIVRTGSSLYERAKKEATDPLFAQKLVASIRLSEEVASAVGQQDQTLMALSRHANIHSHTPDPSSLEVIGKCEANRDKLVQKLLELLSTLALMKVHQGSGYGSDLEELEAITRELEEDSKIQLEAADEVKAYLEAGDKEAVLC